MGAANPMDQQDDQRRGGPLRYVEPPRSTPSHNRPARGKRRQQQGWSSQAKRGPKKPGRSVPVAIPDVGMTREVVEGTQAGTCLLYTSDAADDLLCVALGCRR